MARKISDRERLVLFALTGTKEQLQEAVEILTAAIKARFEGNRKTKAEKPIKAVGTG